MYNDKNGKYLKDTARQAAEPYFDKSYSIFYRRDFFFISINANPGG